MMVYWPLNLTMLGCGNMGGAMLDRWLAQGMPRQFVTVVNRSGVPPRDGVRTLTMMPPEQPEILVVAVKPDQLDVAAKAISALEKPPMVLMSILAGVDLATLKARLPAETHVRAMPNLPVGIGQGVTLLHGDPDARLAINNVAVPLGLAEWIEDEALFDAATALSGSGPGFLFRYIDALATAATRIGLPAEQAARLAKATVTGAAVQAALTREAPGDLARRVASKGGSTQAGYDVLDRDHALVELMTEMLTAARDRNTEMGAAARATS